MYFGRTIRKNLMKAFGLPIAHTPFAPVLTWSEVSLNRSPDTMSETVWAFTSRTLGPVIPPESPSWRASAESSGE